MGKKICLVGVLWLLTSLALAKEASAFSNPRNAINLLPQSPEFTITLKSNPTTGYNWFLSSYNGVLIEPVTHRYIAPKKGLMGASGTQVFTFRAKPEAFHVPQKTVIVFSYGRPWEAQWAETKKFTVYTAPASKKLKS